MTKFILVGGYADRALDGGKAFNRELVAGFSEPVKILMCYFAREQDVWEAKFKEDSEKVRRHVPDLQLEFSLATTLSFKEQLKQANVLYVSGGNMEPLFALLAQHPGWETELADKTVAGSSAGAYLLSAYWYDIDYESDDSIEEGLGLVPVKCIVHFQSDYNAPNINWDTVLKETQVFRPELETVALKEGEFKVFSQ